MLFGRIFVGSEKVIFDELDKSTFYWHDLQDETKLLLEWHSKNRSLLISIRSSWKGLRNVSIAEKNQISAVFISTV